VHKKWCRRFLPDPPPLKFWIIPPPLKVDPWPCMSSVNQESVFPIFVDPKTRQKVTHRAGYFRLKVAAIWWIF
jgi:hypothetical protein